MTIGLRNASRGKKGHRKQSGRRVDQAATRQELHGMLQVSDLELDVID
jgi:hypothetical protein